MAKTPMRCPFSGKMCKECSAYRGRHYYLCNDKSYRGHIETKEETGNLHAHVAPEDKTALPTFESTGKMFDPWFVDNNNGECLPRIKLKVYYREDGTTKECDYEDAKKWEWNDPKIVRIIGNIHIGSVDKLRNVMCHKEAQGAREVELFEAPWFLLA